MKSREGRGERVGYGRFAFFEQETKLKGIRQGLSPEVVVRDDEKGMYFVHEMTRPLAPFLQFPIIVEIIVALIAPRIFAKPVPPISSVQPDVTEAFIGNVSGRRY